MKGYILQSNADPAPSANRFYAGVLNTTEDCLLFVKSLRFTFYDYFYAYMTNAKQDGFVFQLPSQVQCHNEAVHFGKTTTIYASTIIDHTRHHKPEIMKGIFSQVEVDKKTRRPASFKHALKLDESKYPKLPEDELPKYDVINPPDMKCTTKDYRVREVDIDGYKHTNLGVYIRLFMDEVDEGLKRKAYISECFDTTGDTLRVREFVVDFHKESLLGEELRVLTWEQVDAPGTVHGQITRGDTLLTQCKLVCNTNIPNKSSLAKL